MVRTWMMIEAVMKGPTPSITIERLDRPPPEKMFRNPKNWLELSKFDKVGRIDARDRDRRQARGI